MSPASGGAVLPVAASTVRVTRLGAGAWGGGGWPVRRSSGEGVKELAAEVATLAVGVDHRAHRRAVAPGGVGRTAPHPTVWSATLTVASTVSPAPAGGASAGRRRGLW